MIDADNGSDAEQCVWCADDDGDLKLLRLRIPDQLARNRIWIELHVHPRHERSVRRFLARYRRDGRRFLFLMIASILLPVALLTLGHLLGLPAAARNRWAELLLGPYMTTLGGIVTLYPFATPLTVRFLGLRGAMSLVRGMGLALVAFGAWRMATAA